jgi:hypothetical protein
VEVDAGRVLAFRVAGQGLAGPDGREPRDVLGSWAVQDSPPGAAVAAVLARSAAEVSPGFVDASVHDERSAVALYNARTATAVVPVAEAPAFGTALLPGDDAGLKAIVASAVPDRAEGFAEPVALAVDAVSDALDGTVLSRDDLHEELRARLPGALLPWCNGCQSHHARRGLLVMAGLHGRLCVAGRAGASRPSPGPTSGPGGTRRRRRRRAPRSCAATWPRTGRRRRGSWRSGRGWGTRTRGRCGRWWPTSW